MNRSPAIVRHDVLHEIDGSESGLNGSGLPHLVGEDSLTESSQVVVGGHEE